MTENENINEEVKPVIESAENETPEDINWKKFRDQKKEDKQKRLEAEKRAEEAQKREQQAKEQAEALRIAMEAAFAKEDEKQNGSNYSQDESEEEKIKKHVEKALREKEEKDKQEKALREKQDFPNRLRSSCPDFEEVCTEENLNYFEYHHPEIANALNYIPEELEKWTSVYKAIKKYIPSNEVAKDNTKRLEKNLSKPQSISVPSNSNSGDQAPYALNEQKKQDNWARMQKRMKSL